MRINQYVDLAEVVELMLDAVCVVDENNRFAFVSPAFETIFGYAPEEVVGKSMLDFVYHEDKQRTLQTIEHLVSGHEQRSFENRWTHKLGHVLTILWSARWSKEHNVRVAVAHDITARKKMEEKLQYLASHDSLTLLPNRSFMKKRLTAYLDKARIENTHLCLLFIDIDGFKQVNDNFGHLIGDQLLSEIARRLLKSARTKDLVGRLGGDEFLVILDNLDYQREVLPLMNKLREDIHNPIVIDDNRLNISLSIGSSQYPEDGDTEEALMHTADSAMYLEKRRRKGNQ